MNYTLNYYNQALKDVNLDSIPKRNTNGTYIWSLGQENIINDSQYNRLREINIELKHIAEAKMQMLSQILTFQAPADELDRSSNKALSQLNYQLAEIETDLSAIVLERNQLKRDLINRGYMAKETADDPEIKTEEKKISSKSIFLKKFWKVLFAFLIWFVLEVFMTAIQWNSLRDEKGTSDIIVRGLSLGILLGFFHLIAHRNKIFKHPLHSAYQIFNIVMIATMMFLPPVLYQLYPSDFGATEASALWSLSDNAIVPENSLTDNLPFLVGFYRSNEWIPAGLSVIFFIFIFFGLQHSEKKNIVLKEEEQEVNKSMKIIKPAEIRLDFFKKEARELDIKKEKLKKEIDNIVAKPFDILPIYQKVKALQNECWEIDKNATTLKAEIEAIISKLMLALREYEVEYKDVLKSNEIKSVFIKPEWPEKSDIINYFKLQ